MVVDGPALGFELSAWLAFMTTGFSALASLGSSLAHGWASVSSCLLIVDLLCPQPLAGLGPVGQLLGLVWSCRLVYVFVSLCFLFWIPCAQVYCLTALPSPISRA